MKEIILNVPPYIPPKREVSYPNRRINNAGRTPEISNLTLTVIYSDAFSPIHVSDQSTVLVDTLL